MIEMYPGLTAGIQKNLMEASSNKTENNCHQFQCDVNETPRSFIKISKKRFLEITQNPLMFFKILMEQEKY